MEPYTHLSSYGINEDICQSLFVERKYCFSLTTKPNEGFYSDLLKYKQKYHPNITAREFGEILLSIDPWLRETVKSPNSAYIKAAKLKCKRHRSLENLVTYKKRKTAITNDVSNKLS